MNSPAETGKAGQSPLRLDYVDGLRAFAAVYVVIHHILLYVFDDLPMGFARRILRIFLFGHNAVNVFIVVSGFCLMLPVIRNEGKLAGGALNFFRKRARRILPPYYAALALSLVLIWFFIGTPTGTTWKASIPVTAWDVLCHLFLIQDWFAATHHKIDYPLWSISVEWRIYFCFPIMVWAWGRFGAFWTTAAAVIVSSLLEFQVGHTFLDASSSGVSLHYYGLFALGMLAAGLGYSKGSGLALWRSRLPWTALFAVMFGFALYADNKWWHGFHLPWQCEDVIVSFGAMCLLVAVAVSEANGRSSFARGVLGFPPLVFVGTFSYSLYLVHAPLLQIMWIYFIHPLRLGALNTFLLFSTVGLAVVIGCAYLFFLAFERPFIRRWKGAREAREPGKEKELFEPMTGPIELAGK